MNKKILLGFHVLATLELESELVIKEEQSKDCPERRKYSKFGRQNDSYIHLYSYRNTYSYTVSLV